MSPLKLTVCAKPVRQTVGEQSSTVTRESKPIVLYLLIIQNFL